MSTTERPETPSPEYLFISGILQEAFEKCFDSRFDTDEKSSFDIVTSNDKRIEKYVTGRIRSEFPGDEIIGEEFNPDAKPAGRAWTIDPIDGTFNMARGLLPFGMQCAFLAGGAAVCSAIYFPRENELFTAAAGCGAFLNGRRITACRSTPLPQAIVTFGDLRHDSRETKDFQLAMISRVHEKTAKVRLFGSAAYDLASVACGRSDGTVIFTRNIWDIRPGMLLCSEAGAYVFSPDGGEHTAQSRAVAATANPHLKKLILTEEE